MVKPPDFTTARWRKPSGSGDTGCVEVAFANGWIGVRDTKDGGTGPLLTFTEREWRTFLAGAGAGEFGIDRLRS
jgi:hypothetical protein